ncbi:MAG: TolB family protein, partial [Pseudomonadota bacterium]
SALPEETPPAIRRLLRRCLERDRKKRLRDIGDAFPEVDEAAPSPAAHGTPWAWIAIAVMSTIALLALAVVHFRAPPPDRRAVEFDVYPPEGLSLGSNGSYDYALSPDGRKVVFAAHGKNGAGQLYLRALDAATAVPLSGTDGGTDPFWAPDSQWLGFFANGRLEKIDTVGGPLSRCVTRPAWSRPARGVARVSSCSAGSASSSSGFRPPVARLLRCCRRKITTGTQTSLPRNSCPMESIFSMALSAGNPVSS